MYRQNFKGTLPQGVCCVGQNYPLNFSQTTFVQTLNFSTDCDMCAVQSDIKTKLHCSFKISGALRCSVIHTLADPTAPSPRSPSRMTSLGSLLIMLPLAGLTITPPVNDSSPFMLIMSSSLSTFTDSS